VAGSLDDLVPVAVAEGGADLALLLPERSDLLVETLMLGDELGVVAGREPVQNFSPRVREPIDLEFDVVQRAHDSYNVGPLPGIPELKP
jgi:hypothetical protein